MKRTVFKEKSLPRARGQCTIMAEDRVLMG